jgi:hypothetical protein
MERKCFPIIYQFSYAFMYMYVDVIIRYPIMVRLYNIYHCCFFVLKYQSKYTNRFGPVLNWLGSSQVYSSCWTVPAPTDLSELLG